VGLLVARGGEPVKRSAKMRQFSPTATSSLLDGTTPASAPHDPLFPERHGLGVKWLCEPASAFKGRTGAGWFRGIRGKPERL
jgi:hypothetical protein